MSQRKTSRIFHRCAVPILCLAALTSCGLPFTSPPPPAKVDVDTVSTNIVFGAPTTNGTQAAPQQLPPLAASLQQPGSFSFGGFNFNFPVTPTSTCPTAPATSFPAQVATSDVSSMPAAGDYRWAAAGQYKLTVLTVTVPVPVPTFEQRIVRRPQTITDQIPTAPGSPPDYAFTYQTIEPHVSDGTSLLMYWQVKANANQVSTGVAPTVADPEAGLVLKQVDTLDSTGKDTGTIFSTQPEGGLLLLPLPVQPGATVNSTAADTSGNGNALQFSGTVGNREVVDACGTKIQAWGVDGTLTTSGKAAASAVVASGTAASAPQATIHLDVATQMGALIVAFNIDGSYFGTQFVKETARIGQTTGDPVPAQYK